MEADLERETWCFNESHLPDQGADHDGEEEQVPVDAGEDVDLIVDLAAVDLVEALRQHTDVGGEGLTSERDRDRDDSLRTRVSSPCAAKTVRPLYLISPKKETTFFFAHPHKIGVITLGTFYHSDARARAVS